jgi:hypothetical protein
MLYFASVTHSQILAMRPRRNLTILGQFEENIRKILLRIRVGLSSRRYSSSKGQFMKTLFAKAAML